MPDLRPRTLVIALLSLVLVACGATPEPAPPPTPAATLQERRRQDLHYLASELPRLHKNLFARMSREEFERAVADLDAAIPGIDGAAFTVGLLRIVALPGDGHTILYGWEEELQTYPLAVARFSDGWFVTWAGPAAAEALGARLLRIGDVDVEQVYRAVGELVPHDNEPSLLDDAPRYMLTPEILRGLGLTGDAAPPLTFARADGAEFALDLEPVDRSEQDGWLQAELPAGLPLYRQQPDRYYWHSYLADSQTVYVRYRRCREQEGAPFDAFAREVLGVIDARPVARVIVDLRGNGGGSSAIARPLIDGLRARPAVNQPGRLFVVVDRGTFSSAGMNALDLDQRTKAVLTGEPTGYRPNQYGETRTFTLPNAGLQVQYSTKYFEMDRDDPPTLTPELPVELSSADYFAGRDPALSAILAYRP